MNVLKNEIFNLYNTINNLVKKVTASQETYLKDRTNETQFSNWSETVKDLQKAESDMRYLRSAYALKTLFSYNKDISFFVNHIIFAS